MGKYEEPLRKLIDSGEKLTVSGLAARLGCSRHTVYEELRRTGLSPVVRKLYTINEQVFDTLTPATAWLLGFIFADGGIVRTSLKISIRDIDAEVLHKARELFGSDSPVRVCYSKKDDTNFAVLLIANKKIVTTLRDVYGCGERKTHTIQYPNLPKELNRHFIRGYFDGDGGVSEAMGSKPHWSSKVKFHITSNEEFLLGLQKVLMDECGLSKTKLQTRHPKRKNNIRTLEYSGNSQGKVLYEYLYGESEDWCLSRKREKFSDILSKAPKNSPVKTPWKDWEVELLLSVGSRETSNITGRSMNSTVGKLAGLKKEGVVPHQHYQP